MATRRCPTGQGATTTHRRGRWTPPPRGPVLATAAPAEGPGHSTTHRLPSDRRLPSPDGDEWLPRSTLSSIFCIPPTLTQIVDNPADLPAPGIVSRSRGRLRPGLDLPSLTRGAHTCSWVTARGPGHPTPGPRLFLGAKMGMQYGGGGGGLPAFFALSSLSSLKANLRQGIGSRRTWRAVCANMRTSCVARELGGAETPFLIATTRGRRA